MNKEFFTIIELVVVIAIIGVLAAVLTPVVSNSLMKARDARRKTDLNTIQLALEAYFDDNNSYPPANCGYDCNGYRFSTQGSQWIPEIVSYLRAGVVPQDPRNNAASPWNNGNYSYAYGNVGNNIYSPSYDLTAQLENDKDPDRCELKCYRWYFDNRPWCQACGGTYSNQIYEIGPLTK